MHLDPVLLSRIQFAMTVGFHFIFPSITVGLAWMIVVFEFLGWRRADGTYVRLGKFYGKLFAVLFAMGVATGITMEFQFGMNWAAYSRFVGDIFGAPLAAEAVFAFFLESTFLGLYLFGRNRLSKGAHFASIFLTACGATLSAFWIIVANSWQQTPAGFMVNAALNRAELFNFWAAVFNPSTVPRFLHTVDACLIAGAFFVLGTAAYRFLKDRNDVCSRRALKIALIVAFIASLAELWPFGHMHAAQVGRTQPEKLATFEGWYEGGPNAPFTLIGIPMEDHMAFPIRIPGLLSVLVGGRLDTVVPGRNNFAREDLPPILLPFVGFHAMVGLGMLFIALTGLGMFQLWRGRLYDDKWPLYAFVAAIPLPVVACQLGWMAAEVGRQPWAVYHLLRTKDAVSSVVSSGQILFSMVTFGCIYTLLFAFFLFVTIRLVNKGPEPVVAE